MPSLVPTDYSDNLKWEECRKVYSRSQQDFPTALGMWRVLHLKRSIIGRIPLHHASPMKFKKLIDEIYKVYYRLKKRVKLGQSIQPDDELNVAKL